MWNPIGDGDDVFEMRLRSRNGRKSVSVKHPLGVNNIWRGPHFSRLIGRDITDEAAVWLAEIGDAGARLTDEAIDVISVFSLDYMPEAEDELTDDIDVIYPLPSP